MRTAGILTAYLGAVFLGAAAISPWLWHAAQLAQPGGWLSRQPFHRVVDRCLLLLALGGVWPLVRALRLERRDLGLRWPPNALPALLRMAVVGWATLWVCLLGALLTHHRAWNPPSWGSALRAAAAALATAATVAVLEEFLFRGALYGLLRRRHGAAAATLVSSALYSLAHFFSPAPDPAAVSAFSGFETIGMMLRGFMDPQSLAAFVALGLAGGALAGFRERSGGLWASVGLHAGWIVGIKTGGAFTALAVGARSGLWGGERLYDGWAGLAALGATAVAAWGLQTRASATARPSP